MPKTVGVIDAQCEQDHALWIEEIAAWKNDHARALKTLEKATTFILEHEAELDEHLKEVREHEQMAAEAPSEFQTRKERHLEVKLSHNSFRGRHRALIEQVLQLQVSLHKAGHQSVI